MESCSSKSTASRGDAKATAKPQVTVELPIYKCVKEIPACPELSVGDLIWNVRYEIWPGGYEYAVAVKLEDKTTVKFRQSHLEECFEEVELDGEGWFRWVGYL